MSFTGPQLSINVRKFLELAQPLVVSYGYPRGVRKEKNIITYTDMNSTPTIAVGGKFISERKTYIVTIQTETAEAALYYSTLVKYATQGSFLYLMSEDFRKDVTVQNGWINTLTFTVFNTLDVGETLFTAKQVEEMLQSIIDNYLYVTSIYRNTLDQSFIDKMKVPPLEKETYTYDEIIALKKEYLDKIILAYTKF